METLQTKSISPKALYQLISSNAQLDLIDVRTPPEYESEHVAQARLLPLDQLNPKAYLSGRAAKDQPIYVICQSGMRARRAISAFEAAGFTNCILVEDGTSGCVQAGLPVERKETRVLPLIRQVQLTIGGLTAIGAALALWVHPLYGYIPLCMGLGLTLAGATGFCPLALIMARMPWNRGSSNASASCCSTKC